MMLFLLWRVNMSAVKTAYCKYICVLSVVTLDKILMFPGISFSAVILCAFFKNVIHTVALDQRNIFKPKGAGNTAGSAD